MEFTMVTKDRKELMQYYNGPNLYYSIWEFQKFLRDKWKYNDVENKAWGEAAQELTNILLDNGIDMDKDYT